MLEQKYTPDGLPVVTEANFNALVNILQKGTLDERLGCLARMREENPILYSAIQGIIENEAEGYVLGVFTAAFIIYESLRRQESANKLERELGRR